MGVLKDVANMFLLFHTTKKCTEIINTYNSFALFRLFLQHNKECTNSNSDTLQNASLCTLKHSKITHTWYHQQKSFYTTPRNAFANISTENVKTILCTADINVHTTFNVQGAHINLLHKSEYEMCMKGI